MLSRAATAFSNQYIVCLSNLDIAQYTQTTKLEFYSPVKLGKSSLIAKDMFMIRLGK
jgi:hypothetical protein